MSEPHAETSPQPEAPAQPSDPSVPTPVAAPPTSWRTVLSFVVLSLCLTTAALYLYDLKFAQKLVVIDMNAFLNEQRSLLMAGKSEESDKRFDELEAKLNSLPENQVVLLKSVAVRNAPEIAP